MNEQAAQDLEALCDLFDDEVERQEAVLAVCIAQGRAARLHDVEHLEAKTGALNVLLGEAAASGSKRLELVRRLVAHYALPVERQNLTTLITVAPEPWATRMRDFQRRMRELLKAIRKSVTANRAAIQGSLRNVDTAMAELAPEEPGHPGSYDDRGETRQGAGRRPGVIDQRG